MATYNVQEGGDFDSDFQGLHRPDCGMPGR